jgi:hypothetical protein
LLRCVGAFFKYRSGHVFASDFLPCFSRGDTRAGRIWLVSTFSARLDPDRRYGLNVRYGSLADAKAQAHDVRFTPRADMLSACIDVC